MVITKKKMMNIGKDIRNILVKYYIMYYTCILIIDYGL